MYQEQYVLDKKKKEEKKEDRRLIGRLVPGVDEDEANTKVHQRRREPLGKHPSAVKQEKEVKEKRQESPKALRKKEQEEVKAKKKKKKKSMKSVEEQPGKEQVSERKKEQECPKEKDQAQELQMEQDLDLELKKMEHGMKNKQKADKLMKKKKYEIGLRNFPPSKPKKPIGKTILPRQQREKNTPSKSNEKNPKTKIQRLLGGVGQFSQPPVVNTEQPISSSRSGWKKFIGLKGGAPSKTHKEKNPGDVIKDGEPCTHCQRKYYHVSSMKRHLIEKHEYTKESAQIAIDYIREKHKQEDFTEIEGDNRCPIQECRKEFKFEQRRATHIQEVHSLTVEEAEKLRENLPVKVRDVLQKPIKCPRCPPEKPNKWERRGKLIRHLTSGIHKLSDEDAEKIVDGINSEVPTEVDPELNTEESLSSVQHKKLDDTLDFMVGNIERGVDIRCSVQNERIEDNLDPPNVDPELYGEESQSSVHESVEGIIERRVDTRNSLVFVDEFRRQCRCHLCPKERSIQRAHNIAFHLEEVHRMTVKEANQLVERMDETTRTEDGKILANIGIGTSINKYAPLMEEPMDETDLQEQEEHDVDRILAQELHHRQDEEELMEGENINQEQEDPAWDRYIDQELHQMREDEELMERGNINQERANLEPQVVAPRAPIGEKAYCPVCQKEFTRKKSVERHLKTVHKLSKQDVKRHMATVSTTLAECKKCFKWVADSGMTKHLNHCPGTVEDTPSSGVVPAQITTQDAVPKAFKKGGELFKPIYKAFLIKKDFVPTSVNQYFNKGMTVLQWQEKFDKKFYIDKLIYCLDTNCSFPPLAPYLDRAEATAADKKVAVAAYKYLCRTVVEHVETRYGADENVDIPKKTLWKQDVLNKQSEYTVELKVSNKRMTRDSTKKAVAATESGTDLTYNPERLREVTREILKMEVFWEVKSDLLSLSEEEIKAKYNERYIRCALSVEALMTTGGKRPSTVGGIRIEELDEAQELEDGSFNVSVHDHKRKEMGAAHLSFLREGLYDACARYRIIYKIGKKDKDFLFATLTGKAHNLYESVQWLKPLIPRSVASEEEIKSLTAKSWRKGFSNWGATHPDAIVNRDTIEAQDHSEKTDLLNYRIGDKRRVNNVNKKVMAGIMDDIVETEGPSEIMADYMETEQEYTENVDHSEVPAGSTKAARKRFNQQQRDLMSRALGSERQDGSIRPPTKCPTNKDVLKAGRKNKRFKDLYDSILEATGKSKSKVNNMIWTSIRLPKKKKKDTQRKNPQKESEEADSSSSASKEKNTDSSSSASTDKKEKKKKKGLKIANIGKKARQVSTPGSKRKSNTKHQKKKKKESEDTDSSSSSSKEKNTDSSSSASTEKKEKKKKKSWKITNIGKKARQVSTPGSKRKSPSPSRSSEISDM